MTTTPSAPSTHRVLAAGDLFVRPQDLEAALRAHNDLDLQVSHLTLPWPDEPFAPVAEVDEASGTEEQLIDALQGVVACVTQMAPVTEKVLQSCPDLRIVAVGRGGPVNVNVDAATSHGVLVTYAPGRNAVATAEHTIAMLLAAARRIPTVHGELRGGTWRGDLYRYDEVGPEIAGSTVGLIGLGAIGARVAARLQAFGAEIVFHDPFLDPSSDIGRQVASEGWSQTELDELLERSRFVSLHARLTDDNRGMVGREQIARMPAGAVLVNCARGGLLDYDALCDALDDGHLFGAAVDVFPEEPVPRDSRLLRSPHLVITPHLAGASKETAHNAARIVSGDVARFLRGERPQHCANPELLRH